MPGAAVEVRSPGAGEEPWQKGETDRNGHFSFMPDMAGEWILIVDDGMGHREESRFILPSDFRTLEAIPSESAGGSNLRFAGLAFTGILIVAIAIVIVRRATPAGN